MQALAFHNTQFDIIDRDGQPWLRAGQIAQALAYADESSINRIFARNSDEFTERMTCTVKLTDQVQEREIRIFSLRGAHLLAMLARTKVAAEFRHWVLNILDKELGNDPRPSINRRRWLVSYDHNGKEHVQEVPHDACVMTTEEFMQALVEPNGLMVSSEELFDFVTDILAGLKKRSAHQARSRASQ